MDDIRHILESKEMKDVVAAIEKLKRANSEPDSSSECLTFTQLSSGKFPTREVLKILSREEKDDQGQLDVLAAAFSAWLLFPKHKEVRFNWMLHAVLDHMDAAERGAGLGDEGWTVERDIVARYLLTGDAFLRDMYDSAGGYQAFTRISAQDVLDQVFDYDIRAVRTAAHAMKFMHHGAQKWENYLRSVAHKLDGYPERDVRRLETVPRCRRLSVNRAADVFEGLKQAREKLSAGTKMPAYEHVARSMLHRRWKENKGTLALVYAASCIQVTKAKSLLDVLLAAQFSHTSHGSIIPKWLGMARYAASYIFSKMDDPQLIRRSDKLLSGFEPREFPPAALTKIESEQFVLSFLYK